MGHDCPGRLELYVGGPYSWPWHLLDLSPPLLPEDAAKILGIPYDEIM